MAGAKHTWFVPRDDTGAQSSTAALWDGGVWVSPTFVSLSSRESANPKFQFPGTPGDFAVRLPGEHREFLPLAPLLDLQ